MNQITSIQELNNLLNEGKITQAEYDELLAAMSNRVEPEPSNDAAEMPTQIKFSDLAVASFVLSLMTFVFGPFTGIPAIICGHIARRKIKRNQNLKGSGLAMAGLIIGYPVTIYLTLCLTLVIFAKPVHVDPVKPRIFEAVEVKHYPVDSLEDVKSHSWLEFDRDVSHDGGGSFKVTMSKRSSSELKLYETGPLNVNSKKLVYQMHVLKPDDMDRRETVIPVMRVYLPGKREIKSSSSELTGYGSADKKWKVYETVVELPEEVQINNIKLNVTVVRPHNDSADTVWIDDIRLLHKVENE